MYKNSYINTSPPPPSSSSSPRHPSPPPNIKDNEFDEEKQQQQQQQYNFGFNKSQNISSDSYPININHMSDLYNLSIPKQLPNISSIEEIVNNNTNNNGVMDSSWISIILDQLVNLLKQVPIYSLPPLFNAHNISLNDKKVRKIVTDIIGNSYDDQQQQQQQQSKQTQTLC